MLDKNATAEKLKDALTNAFTAWQDTDPRSRTKAEFARLCEQAAGRPCTPQTVGGWFKTGRMDKAWLPVVEKVLGASLGFGSFQQTSQLARTEEGFGLRHALAMITAAIRSSDEITRLSLEPLFAAMVRKPEDSVQIAQRIELLLGHVPSGQLSSDDAQQEKSTSNGVDFDMNADEQDEGKHGSGVSAQEEQGSRFGIRGAARGSPRKR